MISCSSRDLKIGVPTYLLTMQVQEAKVNAQMFSMRSLLIRDMVRELARPF